MNEPIHQSLSLDNMSFLKIAKLKWIEYNMYTTFVLNTGSLLTRFIGQLT